MPKRELAIAFFYQEIGYISGVYLEPHKPFTHAFALKGVPTSAAVSGFFLEQRKCEPIS